MPHLQILDLSSHVLRVESFPDKNESTDDVADASLALLAVRDASVLNSRGSQPKEVVVITEDDPAMSETKGKLVLVDGPEKTHLRRGCHINAASEKSCGNGVRAVLIKIKSNRPRH